MTSQSRGSMFRRALLKMSISDCIYSPNAGQGPTTINLEGIFGLLSTVAWTSAGPVLPTKVEELRELVASEYHHLVVPSVDKFPRMTDYVIPDGVRIADADRVRLGAHLAVGTTVMHEGFVNFNAGTLDGSPCDERSRGALAAGLSVSDPGPLSVNGRSKAGGEFRARRCDPSIACSRSQPTSSSSALSFGLSLVIALGRRRCLVSSAAPPPPGRPAKHDPKRRTGRERPYSTTSVCIRRWTTTHPLTMNGRLQ